MKSLYLVECSTNEGELNAPVQQPTDKSGSTFVIETSLLLPLLTGHQHQHPLGRHKRPLPRAELGYQILLVKEAAFKSIYININLLFEPLFPLP